MNIKMERAETNAWPFSFAIEINNRRAFQDKNHHEVFLNYKKKNHVDFLNFGIFEIFYETFKIHH